MRVTAVSGIAITIPVIPQTCSRCTRIEPLAINNRTRWKRALGDGGTGLITAARVWRGAVGSPIHR